MNLKDLPPVTGVNFLQRVREMLQTIKSQVVTVTQLENAGIIAVSGTASEPVIEAGPVISPEPEVDLTPPPTPTGLTVTAGLTRLIIEWDDATYTTGHGHDRTIIYGATYTSGPLPTFASAVELKQALGSVTDYTTNTGTQWHIWIKWLSKDGVLSSSPAGGTNGVQVTTGKVGTSDLNDLIITSQKLASGAVDALAKFGSGLEPVYNVASLPSASGYTGPKTVYNQADGKLYRYVAGAWTTAVPTTDLTGQVTNAQITDSAVTAAKIASGAINVFDKFAGGLEPVSAVGSLPSPSGYTGPKTVLLTTDSKLYRYTGSAWTVAVPTVDLTGQIVTSQITAGAVTSNELAANAVTQAKFASGLEPVSIVGSLPSPSGYTGPKTVLLTTDNKLYRYTGSAFSVAVPTADLTGQITTTQITDDAVTTAKIAAAAVTQAKFASGLEPVSIVGTLPSPSGYTGPKTVLLTTDNKLYRYTGSAWTVAVPTTDLTGQVTNAQITDGAITQGKFSSGLEPVSVVAALPSPTGYTGPKSVFLTTDNKLYRYTGSAFSVAVPTADLTGQITTTQITDNAVTTAKVAANAITAGQIAANTITAGQIAANTITAGQIAAGTITATEIAASTITGAKIAAGTVTASNIAADTITSTEIAANAITAAEIATDAVTANKILAGSVTTAKLAASAVTANEIATDAVTANKILAGSVTTAKIAASAVTANEIATDAVTANKILAGSVTTAKIAASAVTANEIAADAVTAVKILAGSVTTAKIAASAVTANEIAADAVTANKILAGSVTTAKIAAGAVTANEIAANTILAGNIAAGAVTTNKLFIPAIEGGALNVDPNFADSTAWSLLSGTAGSFTTVTDGVVGNNVLRSATAAASVYGSVRLIPFDATKTYRIRARVRRNAAANGTLTIAVALQDNAGANIAGDGTYWNHQAANAVTASTTWTTYSHTFGAGTAKTFSGSGRTMTPVALLNTGGSAGFMEIQDLRIEEVVPGELIVDGSIVAAKIATDAVTANKIQAGAVVAGKIAASAIVAADGVIANGAITNALIGTAAVDTAKIADAAIVTAKIADANVTTAKIADANITTAKIADASITNAKINDLDASKITAGSIAAARIAAGTITTDKLVANAATVAAASITGSSTFTAASGDSGMIIDIPGTGGSALSLTTTGAPVKVLGNAILKFRRSAGQPAFSNANVQLYIDGSFVVNAGSAATGGTFWPSGGSWYYSFSLPIIYRTTTLSAASHTFFMRVSMSWYDSAGSLLTNGATATCEWACQLLVEENKV